MAFLKRQGKASRTELVKVCFKGHVSKAQLDRAIDELLTASPPQIEVETTPRKNGESGSATKYYQLVANSANCANSAYSCGLGPDFSQLRSVRNVRINPQDLAELADFAGLPN